MSLLLIFCILITEETIYLLSRSDIGKIVPIQDRLVKEYHLSLQRPNITFLIQSFREVRLQGYVSYLKHKIISFNLI